MIINSSSDTSFLTDQVFGLTKQLFLILTPFFLFFPKSNDYNKSIQDFLMLYIKAVCLYVLFSVFFLIPELRSIWTQVIYFGSEKNKELVSSVTYYTRFGLQGFSGFRHAILCAIAFVFSVYLFVAGNKEIKKKWYLIFFVLLGCFIYGRIAILSIGVVLILLMIYLLLKLKRIILISTLVFICVLSILILYANIDFIQNNSALAWIFEPVINLVNTGNVSSHSTNELANMYIMPSEWTMMFGDGIYTNTDGSYYMHTDVGFLRPIFFGGVFFMLAYYVFFILPLITIVHYSKLLGRDFLIIMLLCTLAIFEAKGESLVSFFAVIMSFIIAPLMKLRVTNEDSIR